MNVALNYVLILHMGMYGAAVATFISRIFQFAAHFLYSRFILGKKDYPFGTKLWAPYALVFAGIMVLVIFTPAAWFLRWPLGAVFGIWELLRIRKRRALI